MSIHQVANPSDPDRVNTVLFGLYFTLQVELIKSETNLTHYLLKLVVFPRNKREKYLKEPGDEAIRLIRLDYRIGLQNAKLLIYEQLEKPRKTLV